MDESKLDAKEMEALHRLSRGHVTLHIRILYGICALMSIAALVSHILYLGELRSLKDSIGMDLVELRKEHDGLILEGLKVRVAATDRVNRTRRGRHHPGARASDGSSVVNRLKRMVAEAGGGGEKKEEEVDDADEEGEGLQSTYETYDYTADDHGSGGVTTSGMHETSFWISSDSRLPVGLFFISLVFVNCSDSVQFHHSLKQETEESSTCKA